MKNKFQVGDKVKVRCEGLAALRKLCPHMPPNHYGEIQEIHGNGMILVRFEDGQVAPYPPQMVKRRDK